MRRLIVLVAFVVGTAFLATACSSSTESTGAGGSSSTTEGSASSSSAVPTTSAAATSTSNPGIGPGATTIQVWFLDSAHAQTGEEPLFVPVQRSVQPPSLAQAALEALFAGPTTAEQADGLRFVASEATGFSRVHIADGIARVYLEGGCSSGGSTMTIAGEITPTLKQFDSVDAVKIYDPQGTTETPDGATDSIPVCLEP